MTDAAAQGGAQPVPDPCQQDPEQRDPHQCIKDAEEAPGICAQSSIAIAWAEGPCEGLRAAWYPLPPPASSPVRKPSPCCPAPHAQSPPPPMVVMMVPEKKKALPRSQTE